MSFTVLTKTIKPCEVCQKEVLRYAGVRGKADLQTQKLLCECIAKVAPLLSYKVCYCVLPVTINKSQIDFGAFSVKSRALAKNLDGCDKVVIFGATLGAMLDRAIAKALVSSPSEAVMLDAIGTERIEALCDAFCADFQAFEGAELAPRFSPGYGDLDIDCQTTLFSILDCPKRIGLSLCDSMFMTPAKSVSAFVGIKR